MLMVKRRTVLTLGLLLVWGLMQYGLMSAQGAEIEKGKKLYEEKKCALCHAVSGKGGKRDHAWLVKFLKNPKEGVPGGKMPPVKGSDEEISSLADYLLSLKK